MKVHITQGDYDGRGVIISWVTPAKKHPDVVSYWAAGAEGKHKHKHKHTVHSAITTYKYYNYNSGYIHHATIKGLEVSDWFSSLSMFGYSNVFV